MTNDKGAELLAIVNHQANTPSLWSTPLDGAPSLHETMLQAALRHLHAVIEGTPEIAKLFKEQYWEMDSEL